MRDPSAVLPPSAPPTTAALGAAVPHTSFRSKRVDTGAIFETLRYRISTLAYPPGTALKELELSEEFGVSRTPIRQALQRLELAGLVQPVVGHGTIVTGIDLASMRHLLQYRLELARMLQPFLRTTDLEDAIGRLRSARDANAELMTDFSEQRFAEISHEVRWIICELIANPYAAQSWIDSYYLASRVWFLSLPIEKDRFVGYQAQEISALLDAFERADAKAIATAIHDTLSVWVDEIWTSIAQGRSPMYGTLESRSPRPSTGRARQP